MSDLQPLAGEVVLPFTGELVDLDKPDRLAEALHQVREWKRELDRARAVLEDALRIESERQGTKTLHLVGFTAVVTGGEKTEYADPEGLADELRDEGMPEERVAQVVVTKVSYTVNQAKAKHAAGANPRYAEVIDRHRITRPAPWRVTVEKGV